MLYNFFLFLLFNLFSILIFMCGVFFCFCFLHKERQRPDIKKSVLKNIKHKKIEVSPEQKRLADILDNINNYNGTSFNQKEVR